MSKRARRTGRKEAGLEESTSSEPGGGLVAVLRGARQSLRDLVLEAGLGVFQELLEEDRERLCGRRHERVEERRAYRHGHDEGRLVMGGRQVRVRRPRVRSTEGEELRLETWEVMSKEDPLEERALEQMLCGVSTRQYERSLEPLPEEVESMGTSKSSVSRRFVARTRRQVESFLSRPLGDLDLSVLMFDGVHVGKHLLIIGLGIATDGTKHVLGVVEGATESYRVCRGLMRQMIDRGLVVERRRLVVIDGSKGLHKAITKTFGEWCVIQRCRVHKLRNILDHLPKHLQPWYKTKILKAWQAETPKKAEDQLRALVRELENEHPGAAGSLREGLEETLTVNRLGLTGALLQTLRSTNPIENLNGAIQRVARNVKRWRGGSMVVRWAVTGILEAEPRFRRVRGYRDLDSLESGLSKIISLEVDTLAVSA